MWRRALSAPYLDKRGVLRTRSPETINAWLVPVRLLYVWADGEGILRSRIASLMTEKAYFGPGSSSGGEYGRKADVLTSELRAKRKRGSGEKKWISDPVARQALLDTVLSARDRFFVDLLYFTGIRIGEALTLFTEDLHFGGAPDGSACRVVTPHFHVGEHNGDEEGPSAKGRRILYVNERVIDSYVTYIIERARTLGDDDLEPRVFVTMYATATLNGVPLSDSAARDVIVRLGKKIGFELNGPHMLRHTLATRLKRGHECDPVGDDVIQAILGHANIETTREYTHDIESQLAAAMTALPRRPLSLQVAR
jgi:integrase